MCFAPQQRSFFRIGTSHSGVPFFTSPLSSYLCARRFSEPTFLNLRNHESLKKHATFLTFGGRGWSFFLDFLVTLLACWSSVQWPYLRVDLLSSASTRVLIFFLLTGLLYPAFQLSILSEVRLLNFLRLLPEYPPSRCTSNRRCAVFPAADCQSIFEFVSASQIIGKSNCEGSSESNETIGGAGSGVIHDLIKLARCNLDRDLQIMFDEWRPTWELKHVLWPTSEVLQGEPWFHEKALVHPVFYATSMHPCCENKKHLFVDAQTYDSLPEDL